MKDKIRKQYTAPALEKGLDVLELLTAEADGLNISEIAKRLERSVGELFRMVVVLERRGYVALIPGTEKYALTLRLFKLSNRFPLIKRLSSAASPIMRRLSMDIRQSCHLVVYYEGQGHVVAQQDSPTDRLISVRLGAEVPLLNTCSGHLLVAFSDSKTREWQLKRIPSHHPRVGDEAIEEMIVRVKTQGYELAKSLQIEGVRDIGYPIFDFEGQIAAVLAVPFVSYLGDKDMVGIEQTQQCIALAAEGISETLGYSQT